MLVLIKVMMVMTDLELEVTHPSSTIEPDITTRVLEG